MSRALSLSLCCCSRVACVVARREKHGILMNFDQPCGRVAWKPRMRIRQWTTIHPRHAICAIQELARCALCFKDKCAVGLAEVQALQVIQPRENVLIRNANRYIFIITAPHRASRALREVSLVLEGEDLPLRREIFKRGACLLGC